MSKFRRWAWGSAIAAVTLFTAAAVTGLLAQDRERALEDSAQQSIDLGMQPGREPSLFGDNLVSLENQGEAFEAISVMSFILGAASAAATGTFIYLEYAEAPGHPAAAAGPVGSKPGASSP